MKGRRSVFIQIVAVLVLLPAACTLQAAAQSRSVFADSVFMKQAEEGMHLLYNMQFDRSEVLFDRLASRYPDHPAGPFLRGLNLWWRILSDLENKTWDRQFSRAMQEVIDRSDRRLKRNKYDVDGMFFKSLAIGLRGRLRSNRGSWYGAARDAKTSYQLVVRAAEIDPSNHDFYFGFGIYDYFVDALPRDKWYLKGAKLFFPGGDRERGIAELERTFQKGRFLRAEAGYFLLQIHLSYEQNYTRSLHYATWLHVRYPRNAWFHVLLGRVHARWGRWRDAETVMNEVLAAWQQKQPGYSDGIAEQALFYRGRSRALFGRPDEARKDLEQVVFMTERLKDESVFGTLARLRLGMLHDQAGRRAQAVSYYRQVLGRKDVGESHATARRYLETPYG
jgi:tetratricopeptide (TPR) repeat protein